MRFVFIVIFLVFGTLNSWAVLPDEMLKDATLETRARDISKDLRCLVCQNQSIDDSDAALARDLRVIVRERLTAGDSDTQVIDFVRARYGNYVLLKPPFEADTYLLWLSPFLLLAIALTTAYFFMRQQPEPDADAVEDDI